MVGLAPTKRTVPPRVRPDLGALAEAQRDELFRRRALLGELAEQEHVSNAVLAQRAEAVGVSSRTLRLAQRAEAVGVSSRTLRDYHTRFRRDGLAGLAPRGRQDKRGHHGVSACAVSVQMKSLRNAGEVESETTSRISADLARKLKEDRSMPTKREMIEGMYVTVLQILRAW